MLKMSFSSLVLVVCLWQAGWAQNLTLDSVLTKAERKKSALEWQQSIVNDKQLIVSYQKLNKIF